MSYMPLKAWVSFRGEEHSCHKGPDSWPRFLALSGGTAAFYASTSAKALRALKARCCLATVSAGRIVQVWPLYEGRYERPVDEALFF